MANVRIPLHSSLAAWRYGFALSALSTLVLSTPVTATEFSSEDGEITGAFDMTLSYGAMWRVQGRDTKLYRKSTTPDHDDVNRNDGNRAFDKGLVSQVVKVSADLEVDWQERYGMFIRGTAFYDTVLMDTHNRWKHTNTDIDVLYPDQSGTYPYGDDWSKDVLDGQGKDAKIQDAYIYGSWDIGEMPLDVRFGQQVTNWGEGIFYRDGINTVNALNGASFSLPGSEIKDLLIPQNALSFNLGLTDNLSVSAYYQFKWEKSVLPGRGTYFSTNDLFVEGATKGYNQISTGLASTAGGWKASAAGALGDYYKLTGINTSGDYIVVADTSAERDADDAGQWGVSFKYFSEELNDTEFGFYFVNYNSHVPYIEAQLADGAVAKAMAAVTGAGNAQLQAALDGYYSGVAAATGKTKNAVIGGVAGAHILSNSLSAIRVFPEDIQMYGISFNTAFGTTSIAGELAFRPNAPIWIDHPNDLIDGFKTNLPLIIAGQDCFPNLSQRHPDLQYCLSNGAYNNYEEAKLWSGSLVFIENFGPRLGFDGLYGIFEPAFEYIDGLDDYDSYLSTASGAYGTAFKDDYTPESDRLDKFSWGYTAVLNGELNDVYAGINLSPYLIFKHDVSGNSRRTGNFHKGRKAVTIGVKGLYLQAFEAGLSYTNFFGAERTNSINDRDNIAFSLKYSF
ncbi:DUF1302 domain-containing protein [Endozoicomonas sp. OPT23]|uniref:DUF1302 domain-containing protein n=1 Tax=Endozoicomonas sp. OPT23 TaxID=2072845 RepID=UPI00129B8124|nr:DUF1302 domain-containing protein [Endozoicomonas sp. OPT23]MRI35268.1 DUF1302 domain-containing protein [Endozoicomonas sp. OPT23]